jgi:hypothetical protein
LKQHASGDTKHEAGTVGASPAKCQRGREIVEVGAAGQCADLCSGMNLVANLNFACRGGDKITLYLFMRAPPEIRKLPPKG